MTARRGSGADLGVRSVRNGCLVLLCSVFGVFSCSRDEPGTSRQRQPLRVVLSTPVTSLDPQAVHADSSRSVISNIFELDLDLANSLWVVTTVVFLLVVVPVLVFVVPILAPAG